MAGNNIGLNESKYAVKQSGNEGIGGKYEGKKADDATTILIYTVLYCIALHCTVLHCIALYCTILHCNAL